MENFEQVLEQFTPMINSVLRKAHVYKNHDYFRQCVTIALWQAWKNYDPTRGPFAPYAHRYMRTAIYMEMRKDNRYAERNISYEKEKLTFLAQHLESKNRAQDLSSILEDLKQLLTDAEFKLLVDLYQEQYTYEELAEKYNVTIAALKKRRERLLKKIREGVKKDLE